MSGSDSNISLHLDAVQKTFASGTAALAATSLDVRQGEFVSLVGPSGCGKSTLLRLMSGLLLPSSGVIDYPSETEDQEISFVFQDATLMPWATVYENVALPLRLHDTAPEISDRVNTVLDWVSLKDFQHSYPRQLSGGMKMRVSIARALVTEPKLLLLDEPFAALDEFTRAKLNEDLLHLWQDQKWTTVFVTHSIREAAFLSQRIIVMSPRPGRIVADVKVPFDYPRTAKLKDEHDFTDFSASISHHLSDGMAVHT